MKLVSFKRHDRPGYGAVVDAGMVDLTGKIGGAHGLKELLEAGAVAQAARVLQERRGGLRA